MTQFVALYDTGVSRHFSKYDHDIYTAENPIYALEEGEDEHTFQRAEAMMFWIMLELKLS